MKRILDEQGRVEKLLKGFNMIDDDHDISDITLLAKYFSGLGEKPQEVKEHIIECWKDYNGITQYNILNKIITNVRKHKHYELTNLKKIKLTSGEVEYFDNLDLGLDERKFLFTLYVWCKIQKAYQGGRHFREISIRNSGDEPQLPKLKKAANIHMGTDKLHSDIVCKLFWDGYFDIPSLIFGYEDFHTMAKRQVNKKCAEYVLSGEWLDKYINDFDPKANDKFGEFLFTCDANFTAFCWFFDEVAESGEEFEVEADWIKKNCGHWYESQTKKGSKGVKKVQCKVCGNWITTKSKNTSQGIMCPECRKEYNRVKKAESRKRLKDQGK